MALKETGLKGNDLVELKVYIIKTRGENTIFGTVLFGDKSLKKVVEKLKQ